jgi:predicted regulator of Ras-like GTPase activity (Roadblock/LC7/MglB family)
MPSEDFEGVARQLRVDGAGKKVQKMPSFVGQFDTQLADMIIDVPTSTSMTTVLGRLVKDANASSGMVLDRAGQIIVWQGIDYKDESMKLGALIAGTYASTREMARILGETNFRMLLQEGAKEKIYTEAVGEYWLVSVIFDRQTHLGLVKVLCDRASNDLWNLLLKAIELNKNRPRLLDSGLQRVTKDTIDLIFRDDPGS